MACSDTQEHEVVLAFQTEEGIACERIEPGVLALGTITDRSVKVHLPPGIAWQLVAELTALSGSAGADAGRHGRSLRGPGPGPTAGDVGGQGKRTRSFGGAR
jgi:hypothetical protein